MGLLVTTNPQRTLWEALLPPGYEQPPPRLARVDALFDDPVFFEPYRALRYFPAELGRPSIPIETYLRMMFLKVQYRLGYESLCREVGDSLTWLRFCRIGLGTSVPHPSRLGKLTTRCGAGVITELNEALLAKANDAKVVKTGQVRADTTVVTANVTYPTDSGLLVRATTLIVGLVARIPDQRPQAPVRLGPHPVRRPRRRRSLVRVRRLHPTNGIRISNLIATAAADQPEPTSAIGCATTPGRRGTGQPGSAPPSEEPAA